MHRHSQIHLILMTFSSLYISQLVILMMMMMMIVDLYSALRRVLHHQDNRQNFPKMHFSGSLPISDLLLKTMSQEQILQLKIHNICRRCMCM